jgi:hypothetical protein
VLSNQVFKNTRNIMLGTHGIHDSLGTGLADKKLSHLGTAMAKDAIIMCRSVAEECISGNALIPTVNVASWETRLEVLSQGQTRRSASKLGSSCDGFLDTINWNSTKEGSHDFQVRRSSRNGMLKGNILTALMNEEVNVIV